MQSNIITIKYYLYLDNFTSNEHWIEKHTGMIITRNNGILTLTTNTSGEKQYTLNQSIPDGYCIEYTIENDWNYQATAFYIWKDSSYDNCWIWCAWGGDNDRWDYSSSNNRNYTPHAGSIMKIINNGNILSVYCDDTLIITKSKVNGDMYFGLYTNKNRLQNLSNLKIKKLS